MALKSRVISFLIVMIYLVNTLSAGIVWTNYSDSTSTEFDIISNQAPTPIPSPERECKQPTKEVKKKQDEITYSSWKCVNNALQRNVIINDNSFTEYGGSCGLTISPNTENETKKTNKLSTELIILPLIFIISILIILVLISLVLLTR